MRFVHANFKLKNCVRVPVFAFLLGVLAHGISVSFISHPSAWAEVSLKTPAAVPSKNPELPKTAEVSADQALEVPSKIPDELKGIGVTEHLGDQVFIEDYTFKDETGKTVKLADYFNQGRPVILSLVYYECPMLCNLLLNGFLKSLKELDWIPGKNFEIVTLSINPNEGPELAAKKKAVYLKSLGREGAEKGWHFLTGEEAQIQKLAKQVGFGYRYDVKEKQYLHSAVLFALTPDGKISRNLYGIEFKKSDLRLTLLEASNGKIGTIIDRILLFCYRYDPQTRKYSIYLTKLMQAGCGGTLLIFGGYLALCWRRERKGA